MAGGRPTVMTQACINKLEEAFAMGCSDKEACFYADITPACLYKYQQKNPEFIERKELLKENPILKARSCVVKAIETDSDLALKFLERKLKSEFSTQQNLEVSGDIKITVDQAQNIAKFADADDE